MFKGFYTAAAGMLSQQRQTDLLTNNIANANTPGFKADQGTLKAFPDMLLQRMESEDLPTDRSISVQNKKEIGTINTGVYMQETVPNFTQGDLQQTSQSTDIALMEQNMPTKEGGLFFVVQSPDNTPQYTRNSNFTLDQEGFLTTSTGAYVLNTNNQPIQLKSENFTVDSQGNVTENNQQVAQIDIAYASDLQTIKKAGNGLYETLNNQPLPSARNNPGISYQVKQGFVERSNVDAAQSMTDLLTAYRAFEANQKIMQAYDRSMDKAANEIGRVR